MKKPVYSAVLPAFLLRNQHITTLEYFEGSKAYTVLWKEFRDIGLSLPSIYRPSLMLAGLFLIENRKLPLKMRL